MALEDKKRIDVALVCNHVYKPEEGVNNYEGRTIYTLQMAYNNARLITRPDSDWLMADMAINNLSFSFLYTYNSCFSTLALAGRPLFLVIGLAFET